MSCPTVRRSGEPGPGCFPRLILGKYRRKMDMSECSRVGVTRDFLKSDGTIGFGDIGLDLLDAAPRVEWEFLAEDTRELRADQVRDYDALLVLAPRVTAATLEGAERLAIVARFGVGYDDVDVA